MSDAVRIVLAERPAGLPTSQAFREEHIELPPPGPKQVLVRTRYLSLDPYMRGRMSDAPSYVAPVGLGEPMAGEVVGEVEDDPSGQFAKGTVVRAFGGWQSRFLATADELTPVDPALGPISTALGVLGMPGFTAYAALEGIAKPQPGETIVIGSASGPVGALAGQLARLAGLRTVGIAGGAEKCRFVENELGFDLCLDRHESNLAERLAVACPDGVDIYLELTGGALLEAVLPLMNLHGRIPVVGLIAWYNDQVARPGPDQLPGFMRKVLTKRLHVEGMIVWDYEQLRADFLAKVSSELKAGRIIHKEDVVQGLTNAPAAFIGMLEGKNFGKLLVEI